MKANNLLDIKNQKNYLVFLKLKKAKQKHMMDKPIMVYML